jgi:DNA-binding transcriptional regulator GbsR (MarR family)
VSDSREAIIQACQAVGSLMELWGFKRIHGVLWTYLYLHDRPLDAQELREGLEISTGLVSMTVHELMRWGVVTRQVAPGARRERYRAEPDIWRAVAKVLRERELFCLRLAIDEIRESTTTLAENGQPEGFSQAGQRLDELVSLGELAGDLMDQFLQAGTLDIRTVREVRLGMGVAKLLTRKRRARP